MTLLRGVAVLLVVLVAPAEARADGPLGALSVRAGAELAVYQDSDATSVTSPVVFAGVENVLGGWGVSGSLLVDVVSTASADIVATNPIPTRIAATMALSKGPRRRMPITAPPNTSECDRTGCNRNSSNSLCVRTPSNP